MASNNRETHYVLLGVAQTATDDEIRTAYKKMALKWHPDKNPNNAEAASEMFKNIGNAYDVLSDPFQRRVYDGSLGGKERGPDVNEQNHQSGSTSSRAGSYSQQRRDPNEEFRRAQDIFSQFFPGFSYSSSCSGTSGFSSSCSTSSMNGKHVTVKTTTSFDGNGRKITRKETIIRNPDGTVSTFLEHSGGGTKKGTPVKAAKTTKPTSSTTSSSSGVVPGGTVSDKTLASLLVTGSLERSYTMKQMKVMLAERRLKVSGSKQELIERLGNYVKGLKNMHESPGSAPRPPPPPQQQPRQQQPPQPQPQQHHQQVAGIPVGYLVRLHGLNADDYNGKMANVKSLVNDNGRQMVELLGNIAPPLKKQINIKPENMAVVRRIVVDE